MLYILHLATRLTSTSLKNGYLPMDKTGDYMSAQANRIQWRTAVEWLEAWRVARWRGMGSSLHLVFLSRRVASFCRKELEVPAGRLRYAAACSTPVVLRAQDLLPLVPGGARHASASADGPRGVMPSARWIRSRLRIGGYMSSEVGPCLVLALFVHGTFNKNFFFDTAWAFSPPGVPFTLSQSMTE